MSARIAQILFLVLVGTLGYSPDTYSKGGHRFRGVTILKSGELSSESAKNKKIREIVDDIEYLFLQIQPSQGNATNYSGRWSGEDSIQPTIDSISKLAKEVLKQNPKNSKQEIKEHIAVIQIKLGQLRVKTKQTSGYLDSGSSAGFEWNQDDQMSELRNLVRVLALHVEPTCRVLLEKLKI